MSLSYREIEDVLMQGLRLYHYPIAVTFFPTDEEVSYFKQVTRHVVPAKPLTFCQWEIAARMEGKTVVAEKKRLGCCPAKISFGWEDIGEDDINSLTDAYTDFEAAKMIMNSKPRLPRDSIKAISVGPLGKAVIPPQVIHLYCDNMQSHSLAVAYMKAMKIHPLRPMVCESSSACGGSVFCHQEQTFNLSPCCKGSYNSGKTERGEVNVFIPATHLESTVNCLVDTVLNNEEETFPGPDICKNCALITFHEQS